MCNKRAHPVYTLQVVNPGGQDLGLRTWTGSVIKRIEKMDNSVWLELLLIGRPNPSCRSKSCTVLRNWIQDTIRIIGCESPEMWCGTTPGCIAAHASPDASFAALYASIRRRWPSTPMLAIFCNDWSGFTNVVRCMNDGIDDFLRCPFGRDEASARLQRLLSYRAGAASLPQPRAWQPDNLIGSSAKFLEVVDQLPAIAQSDATVLVLGETGTGKEVFARAVHYLSERKGHAFIPVNCGSLPDNLLENELFGHIKGAYTDASTNETGILKAAEGGTIFLDEVDSLSAGAQVKLLRFLQDHQYRPLGSSVSVTANVRVLAAANANLRTLVQMKAFREDLFYRLNVLSLRIPPLRDRPEDIPPLAEHFLRRFHPASRAAPVHFSPAVVQKLLMHTWPGNIRELEGVIHRAVVLCRSSVISTGDIELESDQPESVEGQACLKDAKRSLVERFERLYLIGLLDNHHGNLSRAAREAGKERRTFQRLLKKYNLDREQFR